MDSIDPNVRGRPTDYPINNDESPISVVNFNGVGGSTILYTAHFPRLHPSDFRVRTLDGVADGVIYYDADGVNPTSTIQALALYIADTMKKNLANLFD